MKKVCIIHSDDAYRSMFLERGWEIVKHVDQADIVQFTGGSDVSPALYGEENKGSYTNSHRDLVEIGVFMECLRLKKPMAGICRGGQFLNVMSGGKMFQDVTGHACGHNHTVQCLDGSVVLVSSTHHQMMRPSDDGLVLMCANIVGENDCEAVYYEHTHCLCFQPHPEFNSVEECRSKYFEYIRNCLLGEM